ncbi:MAG: hypothetical protein ACLFP2_05605 [Candidatus Woesearchaeota archaeon]
MRPHQKVDFITRREQIKTLRPVCSYMSIDMDCYQDVNARELGFTPLDGWMTPGDMEECIHRIRPYGIDICEITDIPKH